MLAAVCWLASSILAAAGEDDGPTTKGTQQDGASPQVSGQSDKAKEPEVGGATRKKTAGRAALAKKKADRTQAAKKKASRDTGLAMEPGIVCKSIEGFDRYEPLPGASQTADEKLLVYIRPTGFQTEIVKGAVEGHLTADGEVRKSGERTVLRQKKKMLEFRPHAVPGAELVYLKGSISLKGLAPGDYEFTIILHDEIAKGSPASQVIKFTVIPSKNPRKEMPPSTPHVLDSLYAPFLNFPDPEDDDY
jgi:hypothetical protein